MRTKRIIIYLVGFLFAIPIALTSYINSSFLANFISPYYVSATYVLASMLTIWVLIGLPRILTRFGNHLTALILSVLLFLSLISLAFTKISFLAILAFVIYFISSNILVISLDIFIEDFSKNKDIGKFRGFYLTIINTAWVLSQIISGSVLNKSSFSGIYFLSALFMLLVSFIFIFLLSNFKDPKYKKVPILKTIKFFIHNKHISKIYILNFILKFFYAWMVIYTPIYLHNYVNFNWSQISIIFTIMLLPFVFLSFPLGKMSDKIGERKMLIYGFLISSIFTLIIPLIHEPLLWIWAGILFATRVGAATIEIMTESYFFKLEHEENTDAISFFRNTAPLSFIIAPLLAIPILFFVPSFEYIFFVLGVIMLGGFLISLGLKDVR